MSIKYVVGASVIYYPPESQLFQHELPLPIDVPQGTILGPLLFIVYKNDLLQIIPASHVISSYADDTVVTRADSNWEQVQSNMINH